MSQGIAYVNGDVEHDQASRDELLARGIKSVPVTIWNDYVVIGLNPKALARLFNLSGAVTVVDVPTMLRSTRSSSRGPASPVVPDKGDGWGGTPDRPG